MMKLVLWPFRTAIILTTALIRAAPLMRDCWHLGSGSVQFDKERLDER